MRLIGLLGAWLCGLGLAWGAEPPPEHAHHQHQAMQAQAPSEHSIYQLDSIWKRDDGSSMSLLALRGKVQMVALSYTQCEQACPIIVADMKRLAAALPPELRQQVGLLFISLDPKRDTPAALRAYRQRMELEAQWTLLQGPAPSVQEVAALLGVRYKQEADLSFSHSNLITILNAEGEVVHQREGLNTSLESAVQALHQALARHP